MLDHQGDDVCDNVTSLSISPDGQQVAVGAIDGTLTLWDVDCRQHICAPIMAHQSIINSVCYSADGCLTASASDDQTIGLWDASTGQSLRNSFTGHDGGVLVVGFMADAGTVISVSRDRVVIVWKATTCEVEQKFRISLDARSLATLSSDGEKLLATHRRGITVWNTITMESIKTIALEGPMVLCMGLSQDATKVALGMTDNNISLWDLEKNEVESPRLEGEMEPPLYVAWSPEGKTISSVAQNATLRVWSVDGGICMPESHRTMGPITYSPGGSFIVCPGDDGSPEVWEVPQMPHDSVSSVLDLPAPAVSMRRKTGATESDAFWDVSDNVPATSTQHIQRPAKAEGPPARNIPPKGRGYFSRALRRLFVRGKESTVKRKSSVAATPETHGEMSQSTHITATSRTPHITDGTNYPCLPFKWRNVRTFVESRYPASKI